VPDDDELKMMAASDDVRMLERQYEATVEELHGLRTAAMRSSVGHRSVFGGVGLVVGVGVEPSVTPTRCAGARLRWN
jgi:hypothetical protein